MTTLKYRELSLTRRIVFTLVWVGICTIPFIMVAVILINFFNTNFEPGSDTVQNLIMISLVLIGVFTIMLPALILIKYVGKKCTLIIDNHSIMITKSKEINKIELKDIIFMELEKLSVPIFRIYGKNENVLAEIKPYETFTKVENQSLTLLINAIKKCIETSEEEISKTQLNAKYKTIKYYKI